MGVLSDLLKSRLGIETRNQESPVGAVVNAASALLLPNNPDRVGLIIVNLSANVIYISPRDPAAAAAGIRLDANGGWRSFVWDEDFELVSHDWYAIATGAGSAVFWSEQIGVK